MKLLARNGSRPEAVACRETIEDWVPEQRKRETKYPRYPKLVVCLTPWPAMILPTNFRIL
jgi:hypothetical protein